MRKDDRIRRKLSQRRKLKFDVAERAFVLVANPAFGGKPGSEHALARWLEYTYVCDSTGVR